ncbi:MAG: phosphotransferase [Phycisphaerales bacterium JB040]
MTQTHDSPGLRADEVREVLSHYALGEVKSVRELLAGTRTAPKALIESDRGRFVLKRRASGRDHPLSVSLSHEMQLCLTVAGLPVPRLIGTRDENNSMLQTMYHVYEVSTFVEGQAFGGRPDRAEAAGATLARAHGAWAGFEPVTARPAQRDPTRPFIEDTLARAPDAHAKELLETERTADDRLGALLREHPDDEPMLLHGDVHPGNFLFRESGVAGFFDFDGVQHGPRTLDVAQGLVQFSLTRSGKGPDQWEAPADLTLAVPFLAGYLAESGWKGPPMEAWPLLMSESLVYEACRTRLPASVLAAVSRKAAWLVANQERVAETLGAGLP